MSPGEAPQEPDAPAGEAPEGGGVWAFLRERWMWWLLPILLLLVATLILWYVGQDTAVLPYPYDVPR